MNSLLQQTSFSFICIVTGYTGSCMYAHVCTHTEVIGWCYSSSSIALHLSFEAESPVEPRAHSWSRLVGHWASEILPPWWRDYRYMPPCLSLPSSLPVYVHVLSMFVCMYVYMRAQFQLCACGSRISQSNFEPSHKAAGWGNALLLHSETHSTFTWF